MLNWNKVFLLSFSLMIGGVLIAQDAAAAPENKDGFMRSEGKIYVVMAIVITILMGLIVYLVRLDRKITRLEKGKAD